MKTASLWFLRILFVIIFVWMTTAAIWAGLSCPLFAIPHPVLTHPWFIATLCDAYWAFITFFVWVAYKQTDMASRVAWFVGIILLGNIATSLYCLRELFSSSDDSFVAEILTRRRSGFDWLGVCAAIVGIAATLAGIRHG